VGFTNIFFNLFTCSAGSQVTGALDVHPPTVHDYLYSYNNDLFMPFPLDEVEEQFLDDDDYYV
jgi:hypothetical protein